MKKVILGVLTIGMMAATTPAHADVANYTGNGSSRTAACSDAKDRANGRFHYSDERIVRFGACECSVKGSGDSAWYTCSVDVYYEKKRRN